MASGCPGAAFADYEKIATLVEFKLADGSIVSGGADFGIGKPANMLRDDKVANAPRQRADRRSLLNGKPSRRQCQ